MLLLTRPVADSIKSKNVLVALGFEVFIEPMFEVVYHPTTIPKIHEYDLVIATSRHGITGLARVTEARDIPMVTVGDSSREHAIDLGFVAVDTVSGTVSDLLQYLKHEACGSRVLYVRGTHTSYALCSSAVQLDVSLEEVVLYGTDESSGLSAKCSHLLSSGGISGILFYSTRTAEIFMELAASNQQQGHLCHIKAYTISPRAKQVLRDYGWKEILVSEHPTEVSLFELLLHKAR
ncbi:uroporphyrinogen-III synthase [Anaplasma platys]|uniref:Uroporphyrinogen-III synthase n=1 Tax=Anaplasma platys TaxID=949 RepID=A0A858PXT1_9RICK|nr:uroporphyrinogen-III synthase [Anaplasma platys]QJC27413.1 uroporphyrinogen-III synthase [Anaplasma platys]